MAVLLHAEGLWKRFGGQSVLRDVELRLEAGDVVLLRGPNGSGKTTLIDILCGFVPASAGTLHYRNRGHSLRFRFPGFAGRPPAAFRPQVIAKLGFVRSWQEMRLFPRHTLLENLALAAPNHPGEGFWGSILRPRSVRASEAEIQRRARATLASFGLSHKEKVTAERISLGEARRVSIVRALQTGATVLFLDEPLASLDADGARRMISLLEQIRREVAALVIVEHVLNVRRLLPLATKVWSLRDGRIQIQTPEEVRQEGSEYSAEMLKSRLSRLAGPNVSCTEQRLPGGALLTTFRPNATRNNVLLRVRGLVVRRGRRPVVGRTDGGVVVGGLDLDLYEAGLHILEAPNGWGKTTLLESIAGLLPCEAGSLILAGQPVERLSAWERARMGIRLLRSRDPGFPNLTIAEVLELCGKGGEIDLPEARLQRKMVTLSGGERQRLALACFAPDSALVALFDEPFGALDACGMELAFERVRPRPGSATLIALPSLAWE